MPSSSQLATLSAAQEDVIVQNLKDQYKLVVLGAARVGKTAIVHQFLYDEFPVDYFATVEEFHTGEYEVNGSSLTLDIVDTSGSYPFPAMRRLAINTADAIILVYAIDDAESFEQVRQIHDQIVELRSGRVPVVVVGNKVDLDSDRRVRREVAETVITIDWEHGFVEASAKENTRIVNIFQQLMVQAKIPCDLNPAMINKRRKSLPVYPTSPSIKDKTLLKRNSCAVS
ncbi:GTP-binding protein Rhes-like [Ornithodoros turicata]|uniref:Putative ras-related protein rap-2a isoform x2 n=1 Tax=Ornithodoros turicata TaxID=34597 RepID=A0A2R5LCB5_9ACAR